MPLVPLENVANETFDYVIIGGGTAGLVLAARLTENPTVSVIVLEAGFANLNDDLVLRPSQFGKHFGQPAYDWGHITTAQKHSNGTRFVLPTGKGLGGSSAINFMCWTVPPKEDINDLEKLGNPGWNWENYLKYLNKAENFIHLPLEVQTARGLKLDEWKSGKGGPLHTTHTRTILDIELKAHQSLINLGIPPALAPSSGNPTGTRIIPNTIDSVTNTRTYSTNAYYLPNAERPNFSVLVSANVNKIITEDKATGDLVASGVEFTYEGALYMVHARREVLVSAGALKSPQILELSGIGRRDVLESIGVPLKVDLPGVGENFQEHLIAGITFELPDDVAAETYDVLRDPEASAKHIALHIAGSGVFTMGITGFSFNPLKKLTDRAEIIQHAAREKVLQNSDRYPPGLLEQYKIQLRRFETESPGCEVILFPGLMSFPNPPVPGKRYFTFLAATNHNFSRGTVHSVSADPRVNPAVDPHYFEEDVDLQTFVEIVKFIRKIPTVSPFKDVVGSPARELNPGPNIQTDAQIADWLKQNLSTTFHPTATLSMLPRDKGGVVDPKLKVYGTSNIRVVDFSIVPLHFASHSQATVYAIAEQAADIIKGKI